MAAEVPDHQRDAAAVPEANGLQREDALDDAAVAMGQASQARLAQGRRRGVPRVERPPHGSVRGLTRQDVRQLQELELPSRVAQHGQQRGIGVAAAAVEDQHRALRGRLHECLIACGRPPEPFDHLLTTPLDPQALMQSEQQQQGDAAGDGQRGTDEALLDARDLCPHVIDVQPGSHDPAPGGEPLHVGFLGLQAFRVVLPLPDIVDVTLAVPLHGVGELAKMATPRESGNPPRSWPSRSGR